MSGSVFVWTTTGKTIHIADNVGSVETRCGRSWMALADADEVLYHRVCVKCRRDEAVD